MQEAWNSMVERDDTVYYLGDFAMDPQLVSDILPNLNGKKILIAGNHDRCFTGNPKWTEHYIAAGFESIQKILEIEIANNTVTLNHFPYLNELDPDQRYVSSRLADKGGWLIHGHVHNRWKVSDKQINVSVEPWNFTPVNLNAIAQIIEKGTNYGEFDKRLF